MTQNELQQWLTMSDVKVGERSGRDVAPLNVYACLHHTASKVAAVLLRRVRVGSLAFSVATVQAPPWVEQVAE